MIAREQKRQVLVQKYAEKRKQLKLAIAGTTTPDERAVLIKKLQRHCSLESSRLDPIRLTYTWTRIGTI